jgi:hypothetical protein
MEKDRIQEAYEKMFENREAEYAAQAQRHVEDSIEAIKQFVKDGILNKKHMSNLQSLLSELKRVKSAQKFRG